MLNHQLIYVFAYSFNCSRSTLVPVGTQLLASLEFANAHVASITVVIEVAFGKTLALSWQLCVWFYVDYHYHLIIVIENGLICTGYS